MPSLYQKPRFGGLIEEKLDSFKKVIKGIQQQLNTAK